MKTSEFPSSQADLESEGAETKRAFAMGIMVLGSVVISFGGLVLRNIEQADVWQVILYRAVALMGAVLAILVIQYRRQTLRKIRNIGIPGLMGGVSLSIASVTFLFSITTTTVANTLFMLSAIPFFTAIMARFFLGEKLHRVTVVTMLVAGCGVAVMMGDGVGGGSVFGNMMALVTALGFAGFAVIVRYNRAVDMLPTLLVSTVILISVGFGARHDDLSIPIRDLVLCFILGAGMSGVTNWLFIIASRHLVAAEVTLFMLLEFSLGPIWVWIFVGEIPTHLTILGGALVMSAVVVRAAIQLNQARRIKRRPVPVGPI